MGGALISTIVPSNDVVDLVNSDSILKALRMIGDNYDYDGDCDDD